MNKLSILGTSNSVREGWKEGLDKENLDIENLSIGASCSGVALCSMFSKESYLKDFNIIELAINDNGWLVTKGISKEHIRFYIKEIYNQIIANNTIPIVIIMPDEGYTKKDRINDIANLYKEFAKEFNIILIDGYELLNEIKKNSSLNISTLFTDRLHLKKEIALYIGKIVQKVIYEFQKKSILTNTIKVNKEREFYYLSTDNFKNDFEVFEIGTRLRKENAIKITKEKPLVINTNDYICGLFIDTNNSKAIVEIKTENKTFTFNAYRSEVEENKTQFLYIPIVDPLKSKNNITISISNSNKKLDVIANAQKEILTKNNYLTLIGVLFYKEDKKTKNGKILEKSSYNHFNNLIKEEILINSKNIIELKEKEKKRTLIIHIGMHKTSSSSIQETLQSKLKSKEYTYLSLEKSNHSGIIQKLFLKNSQEDKEKIKSSIIKNIEESNTPYLIISGEGTINLNLDELKSMKNFFSRWFNEIKIVAYIRTPHSYTQSAFQQVLKKVVKNKIEFISFVEKLFPKYRDRFEKFDKVFGKENVEFWKFEPSTFPNKNVVLDFCQKLNIPIKEEETIRVNESLSKEIISLMYAYQIFGDKNQKTLDFLKNLSNIGEEKFYLSTKLTKPIIENNREDIEWMENRGNFKLNENLNEKNGMISSELQLLKESLNSILLFKKFFNSIEIKEKLDSCDSPQKVANMLDFLKRNLKKEKKQNLKENIMEKEKNVTLVKLNELVSKAQEEIPHLDKKIASQIVSLTLDTIKENIEKADVDSRVSIQKLGTFMKKEIENKEGKKVTKLTFKVKENKEEE